MEWHLACITSTLLNTPPGVGFFLLHWRPIGSLVMFYGSFVGLCSLWHIHCMHYILFYISASLVYVCCFCAVWRSFHFNQLQFCFVHLVLTLCYYITIITVQSYDSVKCSQTYLSPQNSLCASSQHNLYFSMFSGCLWFMSVIFTLLITLLCTELFNDWIVTLVHFGAFSSRFCEMAGSHCWRS